MSRFRWPDGFDCAAVLSFDVDAESAYARDYPERAARLLGGVEERRYGPRVAVPRILRLLDEVGISGTFYVPGFTLVHHLEAVRSIQRAGHELGCHGNNHEALDTLDEETEIAVLGEQLRLFDELLGLRPAGYRAPSWELNTRTPALLKQQGFLYDSSLMGDDVPYELTTPDGPLVEVPVNWLLDDVPYFAFVPGTAFTKITDSASVFAEWRREFEALRAEGGCFVLTLHPWISGRPGRLAALRDLILAMQADGGVWLTTAFEVAEWAMSQRQRAES